jgi:LruC domain-containing protein
MLKKILFVSFIISVLLAATGCFLENPMDDMGIIDDDFTEGTGESTGGQKALPPDDIDDTLRDFSGTFNFETILPVDLDLSVELYDADGEKLSPDTADVFVSIKNSSGKPVFRGMVNDKGKLQSEVQLPGAPEDMTLRLEAAGFKTRTVPINDMVKYASIDRTMTMQVKGDGLQALDTGGLVDTDGDGVPDVYDAMPDDANYAFSNTVPADGVLTIAFEDLLGRAQAGDADYNDFIAEYTITEDSDTSGIKRITVDAKAKVKLAGYKHRFGFRINDFAPPAPGAPDYELEVTYIDEDGNSVGPVTSSVNEAPVEVILFEDTAKALGKSASFTLYFVPEDDDGSSQGTKDEEGTPQSPEELSRPPYNPYIYVYSPTQKDIHLIDEEPITNSNNPNETFRDGEGFPWALLVPPVVDDPHGWIPPAETERIEVHYPRFTNWRESGGTDHSDWYLFRDEPVVEEPDVYVAGYYDDGDHDVAAYWKNGDVTPLTDGTADARANAVYVYNGDVYVAGYFRNSAGNDAASFWKNGVKTNLYNDEVGTNDARASGLFVDGGDVYVSGYINEGSGKRAVYWKNDESDQTVLYSGSDSEGTDVYVYGNTVYVSGYYDGGENDVPCYWTDDGSVNKEDFEYNLDARALAIAVPDGTVYAAGYDFMAGVGFEACYWDAGGKEGLSTVNSWAYDIAVSGSDVYVSGYYYPTNSAKKAACYWKNSFAGVEDLYKDSNFNAEARGITVVDGVVYVSGYIAEGTQAACYWKDDGTTTTKGDLYTTAESNGYAIYVSP